MSLLQTASQIVMVNKPRQGKNSKETQGNHPKLPPLGLKLTLAAEFQPRASNANHNKQDHPLS